MCHQRSPSQSESYKLFLVQHHHRGRAVLEDICAACSHGLDPHRQWHASELEQLQAARQQTHKTLSSKSGSWPMPCTELPLTPVVRWSKEGVSVRGVGTEHLQINLPAIFSDVGAFFRDLTDMGCLVDSELTDEGTSPTAAPSLGCRSPQRRRHLQRVPPRRRTDRATQAAAEERVALPGRRLFLAVHRPRRVHLHPY